ncbi:hypothetical protein ACGIF2_09995 [Cellulomonas sp. P22]|uniref:hypothetical protein n=1 Tax=Cellulomonas sp. P22 TaxID=3373189 RepID=UPI0037AE343A
MPLPTESFPPVPRPRTGFVLYVGLSDDQDAPGTVPAVQAGTPGDLAEIAEALRDLARELLPTAETFTALSLVPSGTGSDDVQSLRHRLTHLRLLEAPRTVLGGSGDAR